MQKSRSLLLLLVATLIVFGLIMLYSTSYTFSDFYLLKMQATWILTAGLFAVGIWRVDYHWFCRYSLLLLGLFVLALFYLAAAHGLYKISAKAADMLPLVSGTKGAFRWFKLGSIRLQPSEFTKLAIILFLANYYGKNGLYIHKFWRGFLLPMIVAGGTTGLVLLGGSLSVSSITGATVGGMAFIAGVRLRYLLCIIFIGLAMAGAAISISPERFSRITSFTHPEELQDGDGYQLWHSLLALGSGGTKGVGFTESRMKKYYLPEAHTDFIVAIVGEELGYVAVASLVATYLLLTLVILRIASLAPDREGALICCGVGLSLGLNAFVNMGVVSGLLPTTGVTAPFLSYGGSSILASGIGIGLILSVSRQADLLAAFKPAPKPLAPDPVSKPLTNLFG